ncbi:MAG: amidohydrolase family protein [Chloroflexota bacterium]|nr:MAG: amidohydrolase family protein [Chloroflexota bacterium]
MLSEASGRIQSVAERRVVIQGVRLIDGTGRPPATNMRVVVEGGRFAAVSGDEGPVPPDAILIGGHGLTMLPGLIDAHVHLTGQRGEGPYDRYFRDPRAVRLFRAADDAREAMAMGYTTVRDCGLSSFGLELRQAIEHGVLYGPRIAASHHALSATGGSCDWPDLPHDFVRDSRLRGHIVDTPDEAIRAVRSNFREGATFTKVFVTTGNLATEQAWPPREVMSDAELDAIVTSTHAQNALCAAHCIGAAGVQRAVVAGVDTIEHGVVADRWECLDLMAERATILIPTLSIFYHLAGLTGEVSPREAVTERAKRIFDGQLKMIPRALQAGVPLAAGTDTGSRFGRGKNSLELELLCSAGVSPLQAIVAATSSAAAACGWADQVGSIEVGKLADFVLIDGDPLADIRVLQDPARIQSVFKAGPL